MFKLFENIEKQMKTWNETSAYWTEQTFGAMGEAKAFGDAIMASKAPADLIGAQKSYWVASEKRMNAVYGKQVKDAKSAQADALKAFESAADKARKDMSASTHEAFEQAIKLAGISSIK